MIYKIYCLNQKSVVYHQSTSLYFSHIGGDVHGKEQYQGSELGKVFLYLINKA